MRRFRQWFWEHFLPVWCREDMLAENRRLVARIAELKQENSQLAAYIQGSENALRLGRRIKIYTGEVRAVGPVERFDGQQNL